MFLGDSEASSAFQILTAPKKVFKAEESSESEESTFEEDLLVSAAVKGKFEGILMVRVLPWTPPSPPLSKPAGSETFEAENTKVKSCKDLHMDICASGYHLDECSHVR